MGGKMSRDKGKRGEYMFRDEARRLGYTSERVPLSGAAAGFKGDVTFAKDGRELKAEIKVRAKSFTSVYSVYDKYCSRSGGTSFSFVVDKTLIKMSTSLILVMEPEGLFTDVMELPGWKYYIRTWGKILNLRKLVKDCDLLAIRDDRKPFLFLRFT